MLIRYVKNEKGNRVGVVVATGAFKIGWSLCNKLDKWDRKKGLMIAEARANMSPEDKDKRDFTGRLCTLCGSESKNVDQNVITELCNTIDHMQERAESYFKEDN